MKKSAAKILDEKLETGFDDSLDLAHSSGSRYIVGGLNPDAENTLSGPMDTSSDDSTPQN